MQKANKGRYSFTAVPFIRNIPRIMAERTDGMGCMAYYAGGDAPKLNAIEPVAMHG